MTDTTRAFLITFAIWIGAATLGYLIGYVEKRWRNNLTRPTLQRTREWIQNCGNNYKRRRMQHREETLVEKLIDTVDRLISIVINLLKRPCAPMAVSLSSKPITKRHHGNIFYHISNSITMAQTVTVLDGQNTVTQQLTPIAIDGVTVEPISTIQPVSEIYTVTPTGIATAAAVPGGAEGLYTVNRVPGQTGQVVVTYTAVNSAGTLITNTGGIGDTYIFQGPTTGVAASLSSILVSQN